MQRSLIFLIALFAVVAFTGCGKEDEGISGLENAKVGDILIFGSYEQDNDTGNGREPISWLVLAVEDGKMLLIAEENLDCQPYNTEDTDITWENCTLRSWLNNDFVNSAFTPAQQSAIALTDLTNNDNSEYGTNGGNSTQDKIFLLSIDEANKYFAGDSDRAAKNTAYAKEQGAYDDSGMGWWWLRSPGYGADYAACVSLDGSVFEYGDDVDCDNDAVRPALWLDL